MPPMPAAGAPLTAAPPVMDPSLLTGQPPTAQPPPPTQVIDDEPPSKKTRTEDHLLPELQFMQLHSGPITIQVQVPNMSEKSEWRLNGQIISVTLALADQISILKSRVQDETGMPPAKQKISYEGMFFKDNNTIAYYNLLSGATVHLQIKERGGRKK